MAFRRRSRGTFRRRIGKPFARQQTVWVSTLFNEVATSAAVVGELVMLDALDVDPTVGLADGTNRVYHVKRIIVNGVMMWVPSTAGTNSDVHSIVWAIYTVDTEDTDANLNTTASSSLFRTERILQSGVVGVGMLSTTAAQSGGVFIPGMPINVDLRSPVRMRSDEVLVFGMQQQSAAGSAFGVQPAFSALTRVLVEAP